MQKRDFKDIFQLYFHDKYQLKDFYNTQPILNENYKTNKYKKRVTYSYDLALSSSIKLKNYHTFLNNIVFKNLYSSSSVYSYKKNHNILKMLTKHKDNRYFFKTDISRFFESISQNMIKDCIELSKDKIPINNLDQKTIEQISKIVSVNNFLPAGFVTSPSISNTVLYKFDLDMQIYCKDNAIVYTRYSDDLVFSSNIKIEKIEDIINTYLQKLYQSAFKLNTKKSKYFDKTKMNKILGLIITPDGHITVPKEIKKHIRKLLYFYMNDKDKFNNYLELYYNGHLSKAYGTLNYINDIDKEFVNYLRRKYGSFVIDKFLHGQKN